MSHNALSLVKYITFFFCFASSSALAVGMISVLQNNQELKVERAEINNVKYGLFNAEAWVHKLSTIVETKINQFELTSENREEIKNTIQQGLDTLITEIDRRLREERGQGNVLERVWGSIEQTAQDSVFNLEDLRKELPHYSNLILNELNKPESKQDIKTLLISYIKEFADSTFAEVDTTYLQFLKHKYSCETEKVCGKKLSEKIAAQHELALYLALAILAINVALFLAVFFLDQQRSQLTITLLILSTVVLLLCGILTPMIEVEAKISRIVIELMGEQLSFSNQILYFQSKSVLDVVHLLLSTGAADMMVVGLLIGTFSVFFPLAKIIASFLYTFDIKGMRQTTITRFFALKSGKWSMADVFVVAMFMAYIGLDGLISSQLNHFSGGGEKFDILTAEGTELQIGFFMFLGFCLASLLVSSFIESRGKNGTRAG